MHTVTLSFKNLFQFIPFKELPYLVSVYVIILLSFSVLPHPGLLSKPSMSHLTSGPLHVLFPLSRMLLSPSLPRECLLFWSSE